MYISENEENAEEEEELEKNLKVRGQLCPLLEYSSLQDYRQMWLLCYTVRTSEATIFFGKLAEAEIEKRSAGTTEERSRNSKL